MLRVSQHPEYNPNPILCVCKKHLLLTPPAHAGILCICVVDKKLSVDRMRVDKSFLSKSHFGQEARLNEERIFEASWLKYWPGSIFLQIALPT
jgi:hypothetical protein